MTAPSEIPAGHVPATDITVSIDRLVVEPDRPVDEFAFLRALSDALGTLVVERGVPAGWTVDGHTPVAVIDGFVWDGRGAEPGLARAVAARLYDGVPQ